MRNLTSAFLAVLALSACGGSASNPAPATPAPAAGEVQRVPFVRTTVSGSTRVRWRVPVRDGQLTDSQLVALAPRIARIKAEVVRVLAIADDGTVLGEIRRYTYQFSGLDQDSLGLMRPLRPGRAEWMAMIPVQAPGAFRTRGPAEVRVIITDSAGRIPPEPPVGAAVTTRDGSTTQRNFTLGGPTRDSAPTDLLRRRHRRDLRPQCLHALGQVRARLTGGVRHESALVG